MKSYIRGISYYLPEKVVTNKDLDKQFPEWKIDQLELATGVYERHISAEDETSADMAVESALRLFKDYNIHPSEIDYIMFCSLKGDYITPPTACILQDRLGIPDTAGVLDYNQGCTGYIYGLLLAKGLILNRAASNVLLINSETITKYLHPKNKQTVSLFGDAASATLVTSNVEHKRSEIKEFVFGTDGKGYSNLIIKSGGARYPVSITTEQEGMYDKFGNFINDDHLFMNGPNILSFSIKRVPPLISNLLKRSDMEMEDIDMFIFHQANKFILDTLRKKLNIPEEKFCIDMRNYGNTGGCSIPVALTNKILEKKISRGDTIMLVSFGVGYSWAGTIIKY